MKFGGSALADPQTIVNAVGIVKEYKSKRHQLIVVTSALPGITDELVAITERATRLGSDSANAFAEKQLEFHSAIARKCIRNPDVLEKVLIKVRETTKELRDILQSVSLLRELTPRSKDFLLSFGERLSTPIVWGAASDSSLKAEWLTGVGSGIVTDDNFGEASPLMDVTIRRVKAKLEPLLDAGTLPIIAGYAASSPNGITTTLGRGGSDYTATIIGAAMDADEIILWKDVEGLMTADPTIEPNARLLRRVSYAEASEMAYFGTKAIHPRALEPALEKKIPIRIRSISNPTSEGTLITSDASERKENIVKAVTLVSKVAMITVAGSGMAGLPGVAAKVFDVLAGAGVNILMISQGSSEAGISFVVPRDKLQRATNALELAILGTKLVKDIISENDICVVSAVGAGMKGTPGVAARVFKAVSSREVNVGMIAQGSSELNISFVVGEQDGPKAVRALHDEFGLAKSES